MKELAALLGVPKATTWEAITAALAKAGRTATFAIADDEEECDPSAIAARLTELATRAKLALPADAWTWIEPVWEQVDPLHFIQYAAAPALSSHGIGVVRFVGADPHALVVALVPWAARDKIVVAARAAKVRAVALGPKQPKPRPKPAKAVPAKVVRARLRSSSISPFVARPAGFVCEIEKAGAVTVELTAWPPTHAPVRGAGSSLKAIAFHPTTDEMLVAGGYPDFRVTRGGRPLALPTTLHRDNLSAIGFVGDDAFALGGAYYPGRPMRARAGDGRFAPIASLPPSSQVGANGFVRTGAGDDVLLWEGAGYVRAGAALKARFTWPLGWLKSAAPLPGDAFAATIENRVYEIVAGRKPVARLPFAVVAIAPAPDGALALLSFARPRLVVVWWPTERAYVAIPAADFGLSKRAIVFAHGVAAGRLWVFDSIDEELRALPWDAIAARPRSKER